MLKHIINLISYHIHTNNIPSPFPLYSTHDVPSQHVFEYDVTATSTSQLAGSSLSNNVPNDAAIFARSLVDVYSDKYPAVT